MRVLFATDGSRGSLDAARFLSDLGHHQNVHVHIITALDGTEPNDGSEILSSTKAALGSFAGHVTQARFHADSTSEIVDGILSTTTYADPDLIVVGARGRSGLARFLLGSVAEAVARHASVPVLVGRQPETVSEEERSLLTEVIVGIDGSKNAHAAAVFVATTFPLPTNCLLRLESIVQPPPWAAYPDLLAIEVPDRAVEEEVAANTKYAEDVLAKLRQELETPSNLVATEVAYGDPATELSDLAVAYGAGLIVVGSRGLNGVERFFLGSVSDRLLWHAPCSVLVCRTSEDTCTK